MLVFVLIVSTAVCAFGWLIMHSCVQALVMFMRKKNYAPPTDAELEVCMREVWNKILHIK